MHHLLAILVPHDRTGADPGTDEQVDMRLLSGTLRGACAGLGQAAEWNAATFARLARSGQVYVPRDALSREELSASPHLAAIKLTGRTRLVPAPVARTEITLDHYRALGRATSTAFADDTPAASRTPDRDAPAHVLTLEAGR